MSLESAFLQMIAAEPNNTLPRLIYADWLEEQGSEKAAQIRRLTVEGNAISTTVGDIYALMTPAQIVKTCAEYVALALPTFQKEYPENKSVPAVVKQLLEGPTDPALLRDIVQCFKEKCYSDGKYQAASICTAISCAVNCFCYPEKPVTWAAYCLSHVRLAFVNFNATLVATSVYLFNTNLYK